MRVTSIVIVAFGWGCFGSGCSSSDGESGVQGSFQSCVVDDDCPSGMGCESEGGSSADGYCSPLCTSDGSCPVGYDCPGAAKNQPGECDEVGDHRDGMGVCDQFDGVYGPNTCD